jgi:hypothetical protein
VERAAIHIGIVDPWAGMYVGEHEGGAGRCGGIRERSSRIWGCGLSKERSRRKGHSGERQQAKQMVQTKNPVSGLLLETGVEHSKSRLHKVGYFRRLMTTNSEVDDSIRPLLRISRETIERCQKTDYALVSSLERDPLLSLPNHNCSRVTYFP